MTTISKAVDAVSRVLGISQETPQAVAPVKIYILNAQNTSPESTKLFDKLMTRLHPLPAGKGSKGPSATSWYSHVDSTEAAELVLEAHEDGVYFRRRGEFDLGPSLEEDGPRVKPEDVDAIFPGIMQHVAMFNHYLNLGKRDQPSSTGIEMKFHALEPSNSPHEFMTPGAEQAFVSDNLTLPASPDTLYAFVLKNNTSQDLYPHVLSFDPHTYAVEVFYKPTSERSPLEAGGGTIQLGSSTECTPAISFAPKQGRKHDSSFWKIILAQEPLSVDSMKLKPALGYDKSGQLNYFFVEDDEKNIDGTPHVLGERISHGFLRKVTVA
jgi:hypothetical protein